MNVLNQDLTDPLRAAKEGPLSLLEFLTLHKRDDFKILCDFLSKEESPDEYPEQELELTEALFDPPDAEIIRELMHPSPEKRRTALAAAFYKVLRESLSGTEDSFGAKPNGPLQFPLSHLADVK